MFKISVVYSMGRVKENTFTTYEEAVKEAETRASRDYEDCIFVVSEIKSVVKAEPVKHPVKTAVVTDENFTMLLEQKDDEEVSLEED